MKSFSHTAVLVFLLLNWACSSQDLPQLTAGKRTFHVELALTPSQQERGLMYRDSLPQDHGMLFVFKQAKILNFWMRNTRIPLDIAYLDSEGRIVDIFPLEPFNETPVPSTNLALYALEVNRGALAQAARGQVIDLRAIQPYLKSLQKDQN